MISVQLSWMLTFLYGSGSKSSDPKYKTMDPGQVSFLEADFVVIYKSALIFIKSDLNN
jgi:hypothetical protein